MGYYAESSDSKLLIKKEKFPELFTVLIAFLRKKEHLEEEEVFLGMLDQAFDEYNAYPKFDKKTGDIVSLSLGNEKADPEKNVEFLTAIAPFIDGEAFVEMVGEDGALWRYLITCGRVKHQVPLGQDIIWRDV